jgi:hypothetical protein
METYLHRNRGVPGLRLPAVTVEVGRPKDRVSHAQGDPTVEEPDKPSAGFDRLELWKEYEGVAMHFNDLIIRLRTQSLGAVAAFATLAAVVSRSDTTAELRWALLTGAFALLIVFWVAVWALDLGYYDRLLAGAVDALLVIEKESQDSKFVDRIELSTKIEERVKSGGGGNKAFRSTFYVVVFLALLAALMLCGAIWFCAWCQT